MTKVILHIENGIDTILITKTKGAEADIDAAHDLAQKIVPTGQPYLIVDEQDLPTDYTFRDAWQADFSNPDGYGGEDGNQG